MTEERDWKGEIDDLLSKAPTKATYNGWLNVLTIIASVLMVGMVVAIIADGGKITTAGELLYERQNGHGTH